jgi:hypothetical protein
MQSSTNLSRISLSAESLRIQFIFGRCGYLPYGVCRPYEVCRATAMLLGQPPVIDTPGCDRRDGSRGGCAQVEKQFKPFKNEFTNTRIYFSRRILAASETTQSVVWEGSTARAVDPGEE